MQYHWRGIRLIFDRLDSSCFTKVNNLKSFIVMWNVRQGNPPLKPYPEWYLEDRTRNLAEDLQVLRENIENKLLSYTKPGWELRYVSMSDSIVTSVD